MTKSLWLTPEEAIQKKKRKKYFLYAFLLLGTMVLSALVTILANNL